MHPTPSTDTRRSTPRPRALITGASRGIGAAVARRLAGRGAQLLLHANRNLERAEALIAELPGDGHAAFAADLAEPAAVERLFGAAADHLGGLELLVNNAGIYEEHPPLATALSTWRERWRRTLSVNLDAPADLSLLAAQAMAAAGGGRIVNVTSRGAFRGEPDAPAYGAAKAGLNSLSQSLAKALAPHGVLVFAVAPGWVETDMAAPYLKDGGGELLAQIPLGRLATPDEIARCVEFLAFDAPPSMTGAILDANGASYLRT